jgi:hypothetical protein
MKLILDSLMITGFVAGMMLLIEYANVATRGRWRAILARGRVRQVVAGAVLGGLPGCLGAFTVVALYSHNVVSFGAVLAAMIAASGDEAFVMLALIPRTALLLMGALMILGIAVGLAADGLGARRGITWPHCEALLLHPEEPVSRPSWPELAAQWRECSAARGILATALALWLGAVLTGQLGPPEWNWIRSSLALVSTAALAVVAIVPDHFLEEHLWRHVARKHVPRVFLWTLGALAASEPLRRMIEVRGDSGMSAWVLLVMACLVGLLPESGPHLVFVTLYAQHAIPLAVLLANSLVQDGHGMLPLLAHSRRAFATVKAINFLVGLTAGGALLACT